MPYLTMSDGIKLYYENSGDGETLLFCHGLNSSHSANKEFYDEFRKDYNTVVYDQRNHADSDKSTIHLNVERLGQDLNEIIESLNLEDITLIGHSMGAATIYSYVNQFGCGKIKRIVACDMSPYMRNDGWGGGIGMGKWSDDDFMHDFDRIFDDVGYATYHIFKHLMNPTPLDISKEDEKNFIMSFGASVEPLTMASFWYSLFRTDQRPAMEKITVPFLYLMPDYPLYSTEATDYIREHVQDSFVLENNFPDTTHAIWNQMPHEVAETVKKFIKDY